MFWFVVVAFIPTYRTSSWFDGSTSIDTTTLRKLMPSAVSSVSISEKGIFRAPPLASKWVAPCTTASISSDDVGVARAVTDGASLSNVS